MKDDGGGGLKIGDLAGKMSKMKIGGDGISEGERDLFVKRSYENLDSEVDFELFLRVLMF